MPIALYIGLVLLSFLFNSDCTTTIVYCNRMLFLLSTPLYLMLGLFITTVSSTLFMFSFGASSLLYGYALYRLGNWAAAWDNSVTKNRNFVFKKLSGSLDPV